ncbi:MAG TPA: hypothetical protein PKD90_12090 [Phnomibacter sp.]|nr:hypothetical protein [Phnomibacter sp.]
MYTGLVHLHNLLRWIILILLVANVIRHLTAGAQPYGPRDKKLGLWLMMAAHIMLLLGLGQYFFGGLGISLFKNMGGAVMKDAVARYWAVEHLVGMLLAIVLITVGYGVRKKNIADAAKHRRALVLYGIALVIILVNMPWPWRAGVGRALLPGMG